MYAAKNQNPHQEIGFSLPESTQFHPAEHWLQPVMIGR